MLKCHLASAMGAISRCPPASPAIPASEGALTFILIAPPPAYLPLHAHAFTLMDRPPVSTTSTVQTHAFKQMIQFPWYIRRPALLIGTHGVVPHRSNPYLQERWAAETASGGVLPMCMTNGTMENKVKTYCKGLQ